MSNFHHIPVLLAETLKYLQVKKNGKYIDCTIGGGGHTEEILKKGGHVLGVDQDKEALTHVQEKHKEKIGNELTLVHDNFSNIYKIAQAAKYMPADGVLIDLGVSSHQLDTPERGFAHRFDAPLDMRMGSTGTSAHDVVNTYPIDKLARIFAAFGELVKANQIATAIVDARGKGSINSTKELVQVIEDKVHLGGKEKARLFQAIRIEVNNEVEVIKVALPDALRVLKPGGRLVVISFHSGEDRVVKEFARKAKADKIAKMITKKPVTATNEEIQKNKRSKSAKLRVIEKI